jgi:hypothetical protein
MKIVSFLILLLTSLPLFARDTSQIHSLIQNTLYSCGERVWPNLDWKSFEINLVSSTEAVRVLPSKLVSLSPEKSNLTSKFRFEKNGITLNLDFFKSSQVAFEFLVHELFHAVGQKNLRAMPSHQQDTYPASHYPRLEREELAQALQSYIMGEDKSLNRTATWFYRHQKSNEDLSADIIEGSAEYVEAIASGISKLGCKVSEAKLIEYATQRVTENGMPFDKSLEHYRIGALSFLAARKNNISPLKIFQENSHPLFMLVNQKMIDNSISSDTLLDHSAEMVTDLSNRRNKEVFEQVKHSKSFVFIKFSSVAGSFDHSGSFDSAGFTYYESLNLKSISGLEFSGHATQRNLCGSQGFLISINKTVKSDQAEKFEGSKVYCH